MSQGETRATRAGRVWGPSSGAGHLQGRWHAGRSNTFHGARTAARCGRRAARRQRPAAQQPPAGHVGAARPWGVQLLASTGQLLASLPHQPPSVLAWPGRRCPRIDRCACRSATVCTSCALQSLASLAAPHLNPGAPHSSGTCCPTARRSSSRSRHAVAAGRPAALTAPPPPTLPAVPLGKAAWALNVLKCRQLARVAHPGAPTSAHLLPGPAVRHVTWSS